MRCKDSKQHHVMFHELYSVSLRLCIAQNVRLEIPYKVLYFETPFLIIFKCYAWVSCASGLARVDDSRWESTKTLNSHQLLLVWPVLKLCVFFLLSNVPTYHCILS